MPPQKRRLTRSRTDRMLGGVCGGLGRALGVDPLIVRILAVVLLLAGGVSAIAYLAMLLLVPEEAEGAEGAEAVAPPRDTNVALVVVGRSGAGRAGPDSPGWRPAAGRAAVPAGLHRAGGHGHLVAGVRRAVRRGRLGRDQAQRAGARRPGGLGPVVRGRLHGRGHRRRDRRRGKRGGRRRRCGGRRFRGPRALGDLPGGGPGARRQRGVRLGHLPRGRLRRPRLPSHLRRLHRGPLRAGRGPAGAGPAQGAPAPRRHAR